VGCENSETFSFTEVIVNRSVHEDCSIWMDLIHSNSPKIRIGYAGACKMLSISEYAKHIKGVFNEFSINKQKNIKIIYINSYETGGILNQNLINKISYSKSWNLTYKNCKMENLNKEFNVFNNREKYLYKIEEVITEEFGKIRKKRFEGILPYKFSNLKIKEEKCYPDSFGLAIYLIAGS